MERNKYECVSDDNCALKLSDVTQRYKNFTLDHVNLTLPKGCIMGFIGENGAGKSTTIKLILNLIHKDLGEIKVLGCDHTKLGRDIKEHIGVVLDECHFPDELNVRNIQSVMARFYKTWDASKFWKFIKKYKIPEDRKVKELSRGMKMKLAMGVAVCHDTWLLILDEATSGMDPVVREDMLDLMLDFIQDETHSIFISSHILSDLEKICDYIAFIHKGQILLCDDKESLLESYGMLKCSREALETLEKKAVVGVRTYAYGVEALVKRALIPKGFAVDDASLEDIMLFYTAKDTAALAVQI